MSYKLKSQSTGKYRQEKIAEAAIDLHIKSDNTINVNELIYNPENYLELIESDNEVPINKD